MKPENLPRQKDLDETLRGRKSGVMKDRRAERGGARNVQMELLQEYFDQKDDEQEEVSDILEGNDREQIPDLRTSRSKNSEYPLYR